MSKKIVKILCICLVCVIFPVAIVVTAICLSNSVKYIVTIDTEGFKGVGDICYSINNCAYIEPIGVRKGDEIKVSVSSTGYDFVKWAFDSDDIEYEERDGDYYITVDKSISLTGVFDIVKYSIKYENDEPVTVEYGTELKKDLKDIEEGKALVGWKEPGSDVVYTNAVFTKREVTLTREIDDIYYMISYDGNMAEKIYWGTQLKNVNEVEKKEGSHFIGWIYNDNIVEYAKFDSKDTFSNVCLNSKYKTFKFKISYDGAEAVTVNYGTDLKVLDDKTDSYFDGWIFNNTKILKANFDFELSTVKTNNLMVIDLRSKFVKYLFNISYDNAEPVQVAYGENLATLEERNNQYAIGWFYEGALIEKAIFVEKLSTKFTDNPIKLYSKYEINTFKVSYDGAEPVDVEYGEDLLNVSKYDELILGNYDVKNDYIVSWIIDGDSSNQMFTKAEFNGYADGQRINLKSVKQSTLVFKFVVVNTTGVEKNYILNINNVIVDGSFKYNFDDITIFEILQLINNNFPTNIDIENIDEIKIDVQGCTTLDGETSANCVLEDLKELQADKIYLVY